MVVSNNCPGNLTKGAGTNLSAVIYGNFQDVIVGGFGGLELVIDPYSEMSTSTIRVGAFMLQDIGIRHPQSFAAIVDADTTL